MGCARLIPFAAAGRLRPSGRKRCDRMTWFDLCCVVVQVVAESEFSLPKFYAEAHRRIVLVCAETEWLDS